MGKNLEELVEVLKDKKIIFNEGEEEQAFRFLGQHNYSNVLSTKYLFSTKKRIDIDPVENYIYETQFKDVKDKYLELIQFETKIREGVLAFETELKVKFTMFIVGFLRKENITFKEFINCLFTYSGEEQKYIPLIEAKIYQKRIEDEWEHHIHQYSGDKALIDYYYLLIKILSFGTLVGFFNFIYQNEKTKCCRSLYSLFTKNLDEEKDRFLQYKRLNENGKEAWKTREKSFFDSIAVLRNALCHKESLLVFLDKGIKKGEKRKASGVKINYLEERQNAVYYIYKYYYKNFENIYRNLSKDSWIMNFKNYHLKNGGIKLFKDIEINL